MESDEELSTGKQQAEKRKKHTLWTNCEQAHEQDLEISSLLDLQELMKSGHNEFAEPVPGHQPT